MSPSQAFPERMLCSDVCPPSPAWLVQNLPPPQTGSKQGERERERNVKNVYIGYVGLFLFKRVAEVCSICVSQNTDHISHKP